METVFRGVAVYVILLTIMRLSGRRSLAQITVFDFVLLLIIAETTQQALLGDDFSVTNAIILILTLFTLDIGLSFLKRSCPGIGLLIDGTPTVLMSNGAANIEAMSRSRVTYDDILKAARTQHGLERLAQIKSAILETDGNISIVASED